MINVLIILKIYCIIINKYIFFQMPLVVPYGVFKQIYFYMMRLTNIQRYNVAKYIRRLGEITMSNRGDGTHFNLQGVLRPDLLENLVESHGIFNDTVFKDNPFELYKYSEITLSDISYNTKFMNIFFVMSFPVITRISMLPIFNVMQVGFHVIENNSTSRCIKHLIPDLVAFYDSSYHDVACKTSHPFGLCRVDLADLSFKSSCFNAELISCPQYPTQCNSNNFYSFRDGILLSTSSTVRRATIDSKLVTEAPVNASAMYIPWNGTRSVFIGEHIHNAPGGEVTLGEMDEQTSKPGENVLFDTNFHYDVEGLGLLRSFGYIDIAPEEDKVVRVLEKQREYLLNMSKSTRKSHWSMARTPIGIIGGVIILCLSGYLLRLAWRKCHRNTGNDFVTV